jgi:hypothetical protein
MLQISAAVPSGGPGFNRNPSGDPFHRLSGNGCSASREAKSPIARLTGILERYTSRNGKRQMIVEYCVMCHKQAVVTALHGGKGGPLS